MIATFTPAPVHPAACARSAPVCTIAVARSVVEVGSSAIVWTGQTALTLLKPANLPRSAEPSLTEMPLKSLPYE